ncbi:MAG: xanthine dehydrogenase family protein molybdopterin-binding subunit, partial [Candidatus Competibacteraceae bacterium]|nr:xanthine dehydrogenase family protein molybdopterin-binding subunit [Candidatus Competibacteraceae bacterium]
MRTQPLSTEQFGLSQAVTRREDERLLTGAGHFTDDYTDARCAHGFVFRTPVAHGRINRLDCTQARQATGVLAVYTAQDLRAAGLQALPCVSSPKPRPGTAFIPHLQPLLVDDTVRCIGDGLAFIVAETLAQARDAAELIELDYQSLDSCIEADAAIQDKAPAVWDDTPNNICFDWELGDAQAVQTAFATAAHIVRLNERNNRVVIGALEPRGAVADYSAAENKLTLLTGTQMP